MWKLHRYYLAEVTISSMLAFLVLFGIVLVASIYRGIDRAQGASIVTAAVITFLWAADTFPHLLAMALLIGSVLTFARASQDREITAIRAGGISPRVPMLPALLIGLVFSIIGSYAQHYLIPWAHFHKYRVTTAALRDFVVGTKLAGNRLVFGGTMMAWESKDEAGHLHDVLIKPGGSGHGGLEPSHLYHASEAWLELSRDGETMVLTMRDPTSLVRKGQEQFLSTTAGSTAQIRFSLREFNEDVRRGEGDKDLTSDQLLGEVYRGVHPRPDGARYTVHYRSCFALMPCLFTPIGFCIGVLARDRGRMTALLLGMVPMVIFYGCVLLAPTLAHWLQLPIVAWLPAAVIAALGVPFCWRLLRY